MAFAHALKAALIAKALLTMMHVSPSMTAEWTDFPVVREPLTRWGFLPPDSPPSAVPALGIDVQKVVAHDDDPVKSVLAYLEQHPADLIVLATHQHEGRSHWLRRSIAAPVARQAGQMTLFIPHGVDGFVSRQAARWLSVVAKYPDPRRPDTARPARYCGGGAPSIPPAMPRRDLHPCPLLAIPAEAAVAPRLNASQE